MKNSLGTNFCPDQSKNGQMGALWSLLLEGKISRAHQWFLILNLIEQGLDNIKKDPKILVPSYLVQNPLIAGVVKF